MYIVECDPDVILVSTLASISRRRVVHAGGKAQVLRKLIRKYRDSIGMIDQDPHSIQPRKFLQRFEEINNHNSERNKLKILHHNSRNNRLIVLCPRLEEWIIETSREANIRLNRYNLPNNPEKLHAIINIKTERFQRLVEDMMQSSSNRVRALRDLLRERTRRRR